MIRNPKLLAYFDTLLSALNTKSSKPLYSKDAPKYIIGGLRHYGEWLTCLNVMYHGIDHKYINTFLSTSRGLKFIKSLQDRICSLGGVDLYRILLALHLYKIHIPQLEEALVQELVTSIHELNKRQLIKVKQLIKGNYTQLDEVYNKRLSYGDIDIKPH